jgi:hypothetical protein
MSKASNNKVKLNDMVSVKDFGAKGDGVSDDALAFTNALNSGAKCVNAPTPSNAYLITSKLTVPTDVCLSGDNWRTTKIKLGANVDMFELNDGASIENVWLDGNGASFTGRGIVISGTNGRQTLRNVRIRDTQNACIDFAGPAAGSQFSGINLDLYRYNSGTGTGRYAVNISSTQQLSATPRKFVAVETNGGCSFDFGGCNSTYITASFLADLNYTVDSRAVLITGSRVSNQTSLTIRGNNNTITGCDINPALTVASGSDNIALQGNSYNNLPIIDNSGNSRNLIDFWYQTYTPSLTSGGTAPTLGNGTITGNYTRHGAGVTIQGELTIGSTTSLGTGGLSISLPFTYRNGGIFTGGAVVMNRGGTIYEGFLQIAGAGSTSAQLVRDTTGSITFNSPGVFASGDTIRWSASYNQ